MNPARAKKLKTLSHIISTLGMANVEAVQGYTEQDSSVC